MTMTGKASTAVLAAILVLGGTAARADTVYLNSAAYGQPQILDSVAGAKFRLDNTNWDMALHSGTGTNDPLPAPADFVQADLGNLNALNDSTQRFTVSYQAGVGFTYSLTNLANNATSTLSWGNQPGMTVATLQRWTGSGLDGVNHTPTDSFNFLLLEARAQRDVAGGAEPDSQLSFSNLVFNGVGLSTSGSWVGGAITEHTPGSTWTPPGENYEDGRYWQSLYSDVDLSTRDWTFSADVTGLATTNSGQELLRFELTAKNVTPVPLPAGVWLLLSGLAGLAALRRKQATGTVTPA